MDLHAVGHNEHTVALPFLLQRLNWTAEEETELIDLVKLFGRGSWIEIRDKGAGVFDPLRTAVGRGASSARLGRRILVVILYASCLHCCLCQCVCWPDCLPLPMCFRWT